jgi:hypothetical protein
MNNFQLLYLNNFNLNFLCVIVLDLNFFQIYALKQQLGASLTHCILCLVRSQEDVCLYFQCKGVALPPD